MLIEIEGIDGAGKTTVAHFLHQKLKEKRIDAVYFKEPSDSIYGKQLKKLSKHSRLPVEQEFVLFIKDREEDVKRNIFPALKKHKVVIMDRYIYSQVYQIQRGLSWRKVIKENKKFPQPDIIILLDIPADIALKRIKKSRKEILSFEQKKYLTQVRKLYLKLKKMPNVYIIDAQKKLKEIKKEALDIVLSFL